MIIVYIGVCLVIIFIIHRLFFLSNGPAPTYTKPNVPPPSSRTKPSSYKISPELQKKHGIRNYTPVEVVKHNKADDLWLIIDDKVFDVTAYYLEHPGGIAIMRFAGGDNTEGFNGDQHPDNVYDELKKFYIGEIQKDSKKSS